MRPYFGQARAKLKCEPVTCCLRARFGWRSGFLSPPAPRGAIGPGHRLVQCSERCLQKAEGRHVAGLFVVYGMAQRESVEPFLKDAGTVRSLTPLIAVGRGFASYRACDVRPLSNVAR